MRGNVIVGFLALLVGTAPLAAAKTGAAAEPVAAPAAALDGKAALEQVKSLAGRWRGHIVTPDGPAAEVVYTVTAGGSTVEEKLFPGTPHEMVSMYHLDAGQLVLTHYCGLANQPRMRLVKASGGNPVELRFDYAGGTNIDAAKDQHMHGGTLTLRGPDRLEAEWALWNKGKQTGSHKFFMERVKESAAR